LVNQALSVLARATDQLPGRKATGTLSVSSAPTFASKILLPRLEKFTAQFPDIRVTIYTSPRMVDLALDDIDIAIRFASAKKPAVNWTLLAAETLIPVCSPTLKQQFEAAGKGSVLAHAPLIHLTVVSVDWDHWFAANGMEAPSSIHGGLRVDTMQMAIDAAVRGLGVVLGRMPLIDDDIKSGRLVPLAKQAMPSGSSYWLVTAQTDFQKPEVKAFRHWLLSELDVGPEHRKPVKSASRAAERAGR
jgi:LysR family transcriptional regulator, glycine cleavage system transcriptional activator